MPLPDEKHPIYKIIHAALCLTGLIVLVWHGKDLDADASAAGVGAVGFGARAAWLHFFMKG